MNSSELVIREARAADLPDLLPLYQQLNGMSSDAVCLEQSEKTFLRIGNYPDYTIYLAQLKAEVVGTFALLIMDSVGHMGVPVAVLEDVVVSDQHRSLGIGRKMMDLATEMAREKGCSKFFFCSGLAREDAHSFYESLGFKQHGYSYYLDLTTSTETVNG